jgi:ABC-2 type transport system ATP-binding protein
MTEAKPTPSIVVKDLVKTYEPSPRWMRSLVRTNVKHQVRAIQGITFDVRPGEICVVLGPNGAGKTTTFRVLVGLTTPTSGTTSVMGYDSNREATSVRKLVGWMPGNERTLLMRHSVEENLRFHGQLQGMDKKTLSSTIDETLALVGLEGRQKSTCFALSSGMKARLQLARALLHKPNVLILDEPTGSVDPVASHELVHLIRDIVSERQIAALISSHRLEEIETLHSRVLLLDNGRVRYDGNLTDLKRQYAGPRLEIHFRTVEAASAGTDELKRADVGTISQSAENGIICELHPEATQSTVLEILKAQTDDIVALNETEIPLQAILANVYNDRGGEV